MTDSERLINLENQFAQRNQQLDVQLAELRQQQEVNTNSIVSLNQAVQGLIEVVRIGSICSLNKETETVPTQPICEYSEAY